MKVLFAVNNESVSESIIKKYQQMYKEIILSKNVYYFNAILKELQKDKTYDRIVISEDLEPFTNSNYETIDNFIFEKLDSISDEAVTTAGEDIPIILIATDRRTKSDNLLVKLFGIGVYSALLGQDRSIEEVCKLIQKPRSKKEAKAYYKIDAGDVDYKKESEGDVSETEIQNILTHYKRLGRNEERYVESFDSIAAQYTDQQLRVIIKFLPLNVKAVLEENSARYQQLISFGNSKPKKLNDYQSANKTKKRNNNTSKAISNSGIKVESISSGEKKLTKPVIIPSATSIKKVQQPNKTQQNIENRQEIKPTTKPTTKPVEMETKVEKEPKETKQQAVVEDVQKKRRGRPKKVQLEEIIEEPSKRKRGRPKKNTVTEQEKPTFPGFDEEEEILPGFEDIEDNTLPGFEDIEDNALPGFEELEEDDFPGFEDDENNTLPGFADLEEDEDEDIKLPNYETPQEETLPGFEDIEDNALPSFEKPEETFQAEEEYKPSIATTPNYGEINRPKYKETQLESLQQHNINLENLLTSDKKIVSFIGTPKNGTSFLINNLAEVLASQGIKTAILDLTENRNSYYIYTKNEEELRKIAYNCIEKLSQGIAQGIKVNNNLDVYTSLPGEDNGIEEYGRILETLVKNYSLILLDCDFSTHYGYLKESQETYLVQSMDVLTIQPLTAYLRELKAKGILDSNKLKVVINKYTRVRGISEKAIIGGMAFYNDPAMSFMTELFNRETIPYSVIPFDAQVYAKYLEGLINCNISLNGYSKDVITALKKLANMVYPLVGSTGNHNKAKYSNPKYNQYANNTFSKDMNSTLDKMKRNF